MPEPFLSARIEGLDTELFVLALRGVEHINQPFRFELTLLAPGSPLEAGLGAARGRGICMRLVPTHGSPFVRHGVICDARLLDGSPGEDRRWRVSVAPWTSRLADRFMHQVFCPPPRRTIPELIDALCRQCGESAYDLSQLVNNYEPMPFTVQRGESVWMRIERWVAQCGMYYYFEHTETGHRLVFRDGNWPPTEPLSLDGLRQGHAEAGGWNVTEIARAVQSEHDRWQNRAEPFTRLSCDFSLRVSNHWSPLCIGQRVMWRGELYAIHAIAHRAGEGNRYKNQFDAEPCAWLGVPKAPARRPSPAACVRFPGVDFATIVGPTSKRLGEVHARETDGCVRIRFDWDRRPRDLADKTSRWVPMRQLWAGASWSAQWIPRIGSRVLVLFLSGDVEEPIVIGVIPTKQFPLPFLTPSAPANAPSGGPARGECGSPLQNGFGTQGKQGTPDGSQFLCLDDQTESSGIYLQSAGDLRIAAAGQSTETIGGELRLIVGGHYEHQTKGELTLRALEEISLRCGYSELRLEQDVIIFRSPLISFETRGG